MAHVAIVSRADVSRKHSLSVHKVIAHSTLVCTESKSNILVILVDIFSVLSHLRQF
jgi:hypothetical protein